MQREFEYQVDGKKIIINITNHAFEGAKERNFTPFTIFGAIVKLGNELLDKKNGEKFAILDFDEDIVIVGDIVPSVDYVSIDVITVIGSIPASNIFISRGTKIHK